MKRKSIRRPVRKSTKRSLKRSLKRSPRKSPRKSPKRSPKRSPRKSLRKDSGRKLSEILKNIKQYSKLKKKDDNEENIEEENEMIKMLKQILNKLEKEKKPNKQDIKINKDVMKLIKEMEEKDEIKFQTPKKSPRIFIPMAPKKSPNQNLRISPRFPELNFEDKNTDTFRLRNVISRLHPSISQNSSNQMRNYENPYIFSPFLYYDEKENPEKKSEKLEIVPEPDNVKLENIEINKDSVKSEKDITTENNNATPTTPLGGKPIPLTNPPSPVSDISDNE